MTDSHPFHEVHLTTLTYGGDALGRLPDGRAVFVPFGLPGERVRVKLTEEKRGHARAELVEVLDASPDRIAPRCKHFGVCGGCHYQHLPYEKQLQAKTEILRDQLARIGKIENPPVRPMAAGPEEWHYRNHVQFHLTREGKPGYVSSSGVMAISECFLPQEDINSMWPQLNFDAGPEIQRVSLRAGMDDDLMLILESDSEPEVEIEAGISVVHLNEDHPLVIAGNDHIFIRVKDRDFKVSAASFFQVNTAMAEKMVEHLLINLPISPTTNLLDLYCGIGLFSAFFASKCEKVTGIESSPSACEDFAFNLDEFDNVELYEGAAEEILPALVPPHSSRIDNPACVLVDPPRAGLDRAALDAILQLNPRIVAYVSCDPSTLARDAARLIHAGYALKEVTPFDLFPQTYHIESIGIFSKD
jgi:23S rRNA (uracil1939-C5)-methyltransferase